MQRHTAEPELACIEFLVPDLNVRAATGWAQHDAHELIYVVRGTYRARWPGGHARVGPGQGVVHPAGHRHGGDNRRDRGLGYFVLQWTGPAAAERVTVVDDRSRRLLLPLQWLYDRVGDARPRRGEYQAHLLRALLIELGWLIASPTPVDGMERLRQHIEDNHRYALTLDDLVTRSGLSRATLLRRFRAAFGCAPMRHLQRVRVLHAVQLVQSGRQPLAAIARAVGLSSQSHLCRLIRREFGASARELRRR